MTFDAGSGPKVGLVTDKGVIDLTDRLGVLSLKNLIANQQFNEVPTNTNEGADYHLSENKFLPVIPDP